MALVDAQQAIAAADLDLHALVHLIVERVQHLTGASGAAIALAEGPNLVCHVARGTAADATTRTQVMGFLPEDFPDEKLWRCDDPSRGPSAEKAGRPEAACPKLVLPLWHHAQLVGVLEVLAPLAHAFDEREIHTLELLEGLLASVLGRARDFEANRTLLEQRTAELHDSEERFESAFTFSAFGMACVAAKGRFLQVNPALCSLFGCPEEELLSADLHSLAHPEDRALQRFYLDRLLHGELRNFQLEQRYQTRNGRTVWALVSVSVVREKPGQPRYLIAQFQDVTAHKRLHERLEELQKMESLARGLSEQSAETRADPAAKEPGPRRRGRRSKPLSASEELSAQEWLFDGWFYRRGERLLGPLSRTQLRQMVETGRIRRMERVWERWRRGPESFLVPTTARAACLS